MDVKVKVNVNTVLKAMIDAAREQAAGQWPAARQLATQELRKLASTIVYVKGLLATGRITAAHGRSLVRMQENTARDVLRSIEGIGVLTARRAIDAAIRSAIALTGFKDPRGSSGPTANFKAGRDL